MCVNDINVSDSDIEYAEKILFNNKVKFDNDRRRFLKNFNTVDLHAVPGSGKTTLLLAKLLIIEKNLPLKYGRGVLVISHTNTAVDEIKMKIGRYCPRLFSRPNFIGTIQSFVNKFLAIPYYESKLHRKISIIDDDVYNQHIENFYCNIKNYKLKNYLSRQHNPLKFLKDIRFDCNWSLTNGISKSPEEFKLKNKNSDSYIALKSMKSRLIVKGVLHYDDAYTLACRYIKEYPMIINILGEGFKYVFVDEMQDMDIHQYELLEKIFNGENNSGTIYQRIGDNNQAIYFNDVISKSIWQRRKCELTIKGSNRLKTNNASLVSRFAFDGQKIEGLNNRYEDIKPILYVYQKEDCRCKVIKKFAFDLEGIFNAMSLHDKKKIIKVIAWRKHTDDLENKISLQSYCPVYATDFSNNKANNNQAKNTVISFDSIYSSILEDIVLLLNKNGANWNEKVFTKSRLINYIRENENLDYEQYKSNVYKWCLLKLNYKGEKHNESINKYVILLLKNLGIENISIESPNNAINKAESNIKENNMIKDNKCTGCYVYNNRIKVCSAHSVKGETHDATLFLESFYDKKYESDVLHRMLKGESVTKILQEIETDIADLNDEIKILEGKKGTKTRKEKIKKLKRKQNNVITYTKLVYVGLSRSCNIVAYGMNTESFNKHIKKDFEKVNQIWDVRFIK